MSLFNSYKEKKEIQQVIGKLPRWIRYGIGIIFLAVAMVVSLAWFLEYPDSIEAPIILNAPNAPIRVFPKKGGVIDSLWVEENKEVKAGEILLTLEDPANWEDVKKLEKNLLIINKKNHHFVVEEVFQLGGLQEDFNRFLQSYQDYLYFNETNIYAQRIRSVENRIQLIGALIVSLENQIKTSDDELALSESDWQRNQKLRSEGLVSEAEVENRKRFFLQSKRQNDRLHTEIIQNKITINELQAQIGELKKSVRDEDQSQRTLLNASVDILKNKINIWKQQNILTAPLSGRVSLTGFIASKSQINTANPILTIVPEENPEEIEGKIFVSGLNFGKIETGMSVRVYLESFPYEQYGLLEGKIKSIGLVPQDDHYPIEVTFPQQLLTSYNLKLPFKQEMRGKAKIIVKPKKLLQRITEQIIKRSEL